MFIEEIAQYPNLVSIDTRTIKKGGIFIAIEGRRFNGHDFVEEAFKRGASAAVVSKITQKFLPYTHRLTRVNNTLSALGAIARHHRKRFNIPVIAITGSNGKTTAKDTVSHVLSEEYRVLRNDTSKNNLIGLPLTLLRLNKSHKIAVLEMGMSASGEIEKLCRIAMPQIGVITNIGPSHLEFLGSLKNIFAAKSELLRMLPKGSTVYLNKDDRYLSKIKPAKYKRVFFGIDNTCAFQAEELAYKDNKWHFSVEGHAFKLAAPGRHNIYNALISIAIARRFGLKFSAIEKRINSYRQNSSMRLEFRNIRGVKILNDAYNSNPLSMKCAVDTLTRYTGCGKKIVVSGDMLELGDKAKAMHESVGRLIALSGVDTLITLGSLSRHVGLAARKKGLKEVYHARSHKDAAGFLKKITRPDDMVLVKGSRSMQMERVIEEFKK